MFLSRYWNLIIEKHYNAGQSRPSTLPRIIFATGKLNMPAIANHIFLINYQAYKAIHQPYIKRKCTFSQMHTLLITKIQVYISLFVACRLSVTFTIYCLWTLQIYAHFLKIKRKISKQLLKNVKSLDFSSFFIKKVLLQCKIRNNLEMFQIFFELNRRVSKFLTGVS